MATKKARNLEAEFDALISALASRLGIAPETLKGDEAGAAAAEQAAAQVASNQVEE